MYLLAVFGGMAGTYFLFWTLGWKRQRHLSDQHKFEAKQVPFILID